MPVRVLLLAAVSVLPITASVCNPADFYGVYGFQLTGTTTIGTAPQPVVSIGRMDFGDEGKVSGVVSIDFTGLYLGNPVMGTYEAHTDCSVSWSLQDTSGNAQHFRGTMSPEGRRVEFEQSDQGAAHRGVMLKAADMCQSADFQAQYRFSITGKRINVDTAQVSGSLSLSGTIEQQGGQLTLTRSSDSSQMATGTAQVDGDCFVHLDLTLPAENGERFEMKFRGMLVDGGRQMLGMATDPGTAVSLRLNAP